jgi:hypothetical protein
MLIHQLYLGIKTNTEQVMVPIMVQMKRFILLNGDINGDGDDLTTSEMAGTLNTVELTKRVAENNPNSVWVQVVQLLTIDGKHLKQIRFPIKGNLPKYQKHNH